MALIGICFSKVTDDREPVDIYFINDYFLKGSRIFQGPFAPAHFRHADAGRVSSLALTGRVVN